MSIQRATRVGLSVGLGLLLVWGLCLLPADVSPTVEAASTELFVASGGDGDCTQTDPCALQSALARATDGDTLYVAGGIYTSSDGGAVVTITRSITLLGGWDGSANVPVVREPEVYTSRLDGQGAARVLYASGEITPVIEGFIVTGGVGADGGGIHIWGAAPLIRNNVITGNRTITTDISGGRGGGIYVNTSAPIVVEGNDVLSNSAGFGGGIYTIGSARITVSNNTLADNVSAHTGGGAFVRGSVGGTFSGNRILRNTANYGGGIAHNGETTLTIASNVLADNVAGAFGGGLMLYYTPDIIKANSISGNVAGNNGGGVSIQSGTPQLFNNMFDYNTRDSIFVRGASPVIMNNTLVGSDTSDAGVGIFLYSFSGCTATQCTMGSYINNIIVRHSVGIYGTGTITPLIDYNNAWNNSSTNYGFTTDVITGAHNISENPYFVNTAAGDYHLRADSPCIDAGDPIGVPPAPPEDFDGHPRPMGARVDMGADEFGHIVHLPVLLRAYP